MRRMRGTDSSLWRLICLNYMMSLIFRWLCDFVVVAEDERGNEVVRMDFGGAVDGRPHEKIVRGRTEEDRNRIYMYDSCSVSIATEEGVINSIKTYFQTHDIMNFDLCDLWYEIGVDHFSGYFDTARAVGED